NTNSHGNGNSYRNSDSDSGAYTNTDGNSNGHGYRYRNSDRDSDRDSNSYRGCLSYTDAKPGTGRLCLGFGILDEPSTGMVPGNHLDWVRDLYAIPGHRNH